MINKDPKHEHTYDAQGKMMCCSLEEKINKLADRPLKKKVKKESCCGDDDKPKIVKEQTDDHKDGHNHNEHSDDDGAIGLDNYFPQSWFTGWVRIGWYIVAYIPVGFPVIKEALVSIRKGEIFSEFLVNEYCNYWSICNWRISRRCCRYVVLCHWRNIPNTWQFKEQKQT
jgi:Cd2+/Zn2+-exporting ATPase